MSDASADTVAIVPARREHLPAIVGLMNASAVGARAGAESEDLAPYARAFEEILAAPETDLYVALDAGGTVVATYQITYCKGLAFRGRPRATVESVHTRADLRGRGIGAKMMRHAVDLARARDCCMVQLTSNKLRPDAHRFYLRLGFDQSHLGFKLML
ncbi:GNAT family N-acetyltransferase [Polymorphum gilvum]|uniref:Acetyltransferase, GNAT family n=1 Tax=Polymorphum gilvum (strain LMG 25793 / CGMCC 1.9160 / SL003B-26A1) TaxID=991905 RepID=F2J3K1_POLGS|nr:GNAT family N-acetyltransferase [Polymorphum gilvum]ADZ71025.1 Acetyltransferase, GNAT family [Polymorphum gilvum SL003B-26A1]